MLGHRDSVKLNIYKRPALPPVMAWRDNIPPAAQSGLTAVKQSNNNYILIWTKPPVWANERDKGCQFVIYRSESPVINTDDRANHLHITPTDVETLFEVSASETMELNEELDARWGLLEGAFLIIKTQAGLSNDLREIYLESGYGRKNLTANIPFLQGYQTGTCFYCGEALVAGDIHVDHVLPRQVVNHHEIWNLVLSHGYCNLDKLGRVVGKYYIEKLIARNENIMGCNHPWKQKIEAVVGRSANLRRASLEKHYDTVKMILGAYYWGGIENYTP